jgi:hypothetical protein
MALRAGAFPEKLGHSACSQPACAGKDWCITHPIWHGVRTTSPRLRGELRLTLDTLTHYSPVFIAPLAINSSRRRVRFFLQSPELLGRRGGAGGDFEARREHRRGFQTSPAQGQNCRDSRKHQRYLAYDRSFSAARHRGKDQCQGDAARHGRNRIVAAGTADLAVMPVSDIVHAPGIDFAGRIAPEIQFVQTFSAAVVAGSGEIEASKRLIEFLVSARASDAIRKSGMEPLANSR